MVLVAGSRVGELDTWGQAPSWGPPGEQRVIQVDVDPHSIGLNRPVDIGIVGDARAVLDQLLEQTHSLIPARDGAYPDFDRYAPLQQAWQEELAEVLERDVDGINPGRLVRIVRDFFPRDAITVQDGGNTSIWTVNYNPIYEPRSYLYTAKFGHLGTGLPYALGAKMAAPERPVYLISGDGAIGFNIQELETARRYDLPVTVIVVCDDGWGMERSSQLFAQMDGMVETELYAGARYDRVAEAFGCHGECVEAEADIRPALARAADSGKPALIQVMVDRMANLAPPGLLEFGSLVYRAEN